MTRSIRVFAPLLLLSALAAPAASQCQEGTLFVAAAPGNSLLGKAVDVSGRFAFAGAYADPTLGTNAGSLTVFEYGPEGFEELQTLHSPTPAPFDHFGQALAADGEWVVVGTRNDAAGFSPGAGMAYRFDGQGWVHAQTVRASGPNLVSFVGDSVALDGERLALGAPGLSTEVGAAYVFELKGGAWVQTARVEPSGAHTVRGFGRDVALDGERMLVGAEYYGMGGLAPGAAFVFERRQGVWTQTAQLVGRDASWSDVYGQVVDLDGGTAVVTGWSHDAPGYRQGAAWVFELEGESWIETQKLVSSEEIGSRFGVSVDLEGDRLLIGASSTGGWGFSQSFVELFHRRAQGFEPELDLLGPSGISGIDFGTSVRLWGDAMFVGNPTGNVPHDYAGAVHFYDLPRVEASAYCESTPNSSGGAARIELACPGILEERLLLRAAPVPDTPGIFFAGIHQLHAPFADGFRCAGGEVHRPAPTVAANGVLADELDLAAAHAAGGPLLPGSTWYFQAWFRDPAANGSGANLSNGLAVTLAP